MSDQIRSQAEQTIREARRALTYLYIAVESDVADDVAHKVNAAFDALTALAARDPRLPEGQGWQPIETAPLNGTEVLLATTNPYQVNRGWFDAEITPGWIMIGGSWKPKYWMPFPAPPLPVQEPGP